MIICILQNAWGNNYLPLMFSPNPRNKSAKIIKKLVGEKKFIFCNTTDEVAKKANGKFPIKDLHFKKVIEKINLLIKEDKVDLILVCGKQAQAAFLRFEKEFIKMNVPNLFIPHPACRNLSNVKCKEIESTINELYYHSKFETDNI